ncbi:MAG: hypothetical protein PHW24_00505 [Candidatus Moranbacteria bacterium]|nr:hypothetical protein [Candidatus Moranbacteria bacterium]
MIDILLKPIRSLFSCGVAESKDVKDEINNSEDVLSVDALYMALPDAKEEVWKRWNDKELRKKVEKYLNGNIPGCFHDGPKAVLARHIASPNNELIRYLDLAKDAGLNPVCLEYLSDKFRAENEDKYYLGKMVFFCKSGNKNVCENRSNKNIIDFNLSEGAFLHEMKTLSGENFIDFHHRLLNFFLKDGDCQIIDASEWIKSNGKKPSLYYERFFALFVCFGILFEDYLENKNENKFTHEIVLPSFSAVFKEFNLKPIIVRLHGDGNENILKARAYDEKILAVIDKK